MKIVRLVAENVKKLRAVEITPSGAIVAIAGKNGAGKTSVLDSIWWALAGASHIQGQPIRKGETKARIRLDLGELVVERRFTENGSSIAVETPDGARYSSPQKMLDALLGELSFDPLAFARMAPREQFDELRRVAKVEVDLDKLDGLNRKDYDARTELNRNAKAKRAQAEGVSIPAEIEGGEADESALVDQMQAAADTNRAIEREAARRDTQRATAANLRIAVTQTRQKAQELRDQAAAMDASADDAEGRALVMERELAEAPALASPVDVAALRQQISDARQRNAAIAARQGAISQRDAIAAEASGLERQSKEVTERMDAREAEKRKAIEAAAMPITGIGFGEGLVTYNGVPFDQASSAEQLRVSMSIAMAANPKLRVIRITDGSLLDEDSLTAIGEMAREGDFQVWIEMVDSSGKVGVVIDDGAVKSTPESRAEAAEATQ